MDLKSLAERSGGSVAKGQHNRYSKWIPQELLALAEKGKPGALEAIVQGNRAQLVQRKVAPPGQRWVKIELTMDSGACEHVVHPEQIHGATVRVTQAVREHVTYLAANGSEIANLGEVTITGVTEEGVDISLIMQVADVTKPLASVRKMCKAGNRVVFDPEGSYIQHKATGVTTAIDESNGTYSVNLWVLCPEETTKVHNMFGALENKDGEGNGDVSGFHRHA